MKSERFLLLASDSTHFVMKLEKYLQNSEICCRIIPLPSEISAGCGLSVRVELEDQEKVDNVLLQENVQVDRYIVEKIGFKKKIEKI